MRMMFLLFPIAIVIFAFNQCHPIVTGHVTLTTLRSWPPSFVGFSAWPFVGFTTNSPYTGIIAQSSPPGPMTHSSQLGLMTHSSQLGLMTHSSQSGLTTYSSHIDFITHSLQSSIITYPSHTGLMTHSLQIGLVGLSIWPSFSGLATQPITQSASHAIQFPFIQNHTYTHIFACKLCNKMKWLARPFI